MTPSTPPVALRNGIAVEDPLQVVLGFVEAWRFEVGDRSASFQESDLRLANRGGARISATEIAAILERRAAIEKALEAIPPDASLTGAENSLPWVPLRRLFEAFAGVRGVGFSKMTKALHPKRPALIPMLDSVVQRYLRDDDLGAGAPFADRALGFIHGYKRDLDTNQGALQALCHELELRDYELTDVRVLDLLIWSVATAV